MKRDLDLIRKIMINIEETPTATTSSKSIVLDGYPQEIVNYHLERLIEAKYISATKISPHADLAFFIEISITWKGHEFLDASRNETIWGKAKEKATAFAGEVPMSVIMTILTGLIKTQSELS